jgi:hypothetical protein
VVAPRLVSPAGFFMRIAPPSQGSFNSSQKAQWRRWAAPRCWCSCWLAVRGACKRPTAQVQSILLLSCVCVGRTCTGIKWHTPTSPSTLALAHRPPGVSTHGWQTAHSNPHLAAMHMQAASVSCSWTRQRPRWEYTELEGALHFLRKEGSSLLGGICPPMHPSSLAFPLEIPAWHFVWLDS